MTTGLIITIIFVSALALFFYVLGAVLFYIMLRYFLEVSPRNRFICIILSFIWFFLLIYAIRNGNIRIR